MAKESAKFFIVGTPIGNLKDISLRALETLREVDLIFCEDTRRSLKLLNAYEIKKPLKSCPAFKEKKESQELIRQLEEGKKVAYISDAGMPVISDPGAYLVRQAKEAGYPVEVIGGLSSITCFLAGLGEELEEFKFIGFLPPKTQRRRKLFESPVEIPTLFFESPHRIQTTLELIAEIKPQWRLSLAKELTKISEAYFSGSAKELLQDIPSWKGEWLGLIWSEEKE